MLSIDIDLKTDLSMSQDVINAHRARMEDAMAAGFAVSQEHVPEDRGTLRATAFPPEWRGDRLEFGYTQPYAEAIDEGTDPFTPPLRPLLEWGDRVFSPDVTADEIMQEVEEHGIHKGIFRHPGAAVWGKIRGEGIDPQPFTDPGEKRVQRWLDSHSLGDYLD